MFLIVERDKGYIVNIAKFCDPDREVAQAYIDHVRSNRLIDEWGDINLELVEIPEEPYVDSELHIDNVIPIFQGFNFQVSSTDDEEE